MNYNKNIKEKLKYPSDIDEQCIELYYLLNSLPDTKTYESCCGHEKEPYMMFFRCNSIAVLTRLGRAVGRNYSDGNWEILVDTCDTHPYGCFLLKTKGILKTEELEFSLKGLIDSIRYWFKDDFDEYFKEQNSFL